MPSVRPPPASPLIGVAFMLGAMASLPLIDVFAKLLGQQGVPVLQIVWARLAVGAVVALPFALGHRSPKGLIPDRPLYHCFRSGFLILATFCFFLALKFLPIADALAIFFVQPLVVTVLSVLVLKEAVPRNRWAAVAVGFIGTLIIIRPGFVALNPGSLLALAAGSFLAIYFVMTRHIAGRAPAMVTTFQTNAVGGLMLSLAMPFIWHPPTATQWLMCAGLGAIATFGHYLIVRAYDYSEASLLAPLAYTEMIVATAAGWYFFKDFPDAMTFLGVAVLIACALYITLTERSRPTPEAIEQP
ncbi:DMT transporter permease [Cypionkella aquatica]|uniref:DMT transporter permease n=1 Tax=Cypionkella aquatica TaxID=1756042 RepID=A0AA37TUK0_9RHOB|nr:DMT family transporter [Cypionkella aquatica]GLS87892.1 DMT transporter permease [Cypionkella aquatica]